jgi:dihydroneopterin aldolase
MKLERYRLFLEKMVVEADIGIHDFERAGRQHLQLHIELDIDPGRLPVRDEIADAVDYDNIRDAVRELVAGRRFNLQETLAREILAIALGPREVVRAVVETRKPEVYPEVEAVGCRLEATR